GGGSIKEITETTQLIVKHLAHNGEEYSEVVKEISEEMEKKGLSKEQVILLLIHFLLLSLVKGLSPETTKLLMKELIKELEKIK
uniref:D9-threaded n=1 Tax=synthetic construct TaxID=32630 RepID=UPI003B642B78